MLPPHFWAMRWHLPPELTRIVQKAVAEDRPESVNPSPARNLCCGETD